MLSNFIGYAAAICTTLAFLPQVVLTIKTRDTSGISLAMYCVFSTGVALWLMYGLMIAAWPIFLANLVTLGLALTVLAMKLKYG